MIKLKESFAFMRGKTVVEPTVEGFKTYLLNRPETELSNPDIEESFWTVAYLRNLYGEVISIETGKQCASVNRREDGLNKVTVVQLPLAICNCFDKEMAIGNAITARDALQRLQDFDQKIRRREAGND
jgi:hypothetical protein